MCNTFTTKCPPCTTSTSTTAPLMNSTTAIIRGQWSMLSSTATVSSILTASGSLLLVTPEHVLTSQMLLLSGCQQASSASGKKSILFFCGISFNHEHAGEVTSILVTSSIMMFVHFWIPVIVCYLKSSKKERKLHVCWLRSVERVKFPGLSLRYYLSNLLPMIAAGTGSMLVNSKYALILITAMLSYFVFLVLICYFTFRLGIRFVLRGSEKDGRSKSFSHLSVLQPQGHWSPSVCVPLGGVFFSQYNGSGTARILRNSIRVPPYFWMWCTVSIGVVMTIT
eukprot:PhF_6_TR13235/c3_g1_i7/m.20958